MIVENERTSFLTRKKGKKSEMVRFYLVNGELYRGKGPGRGYYLHEEEIDIALKKGSFTRILHRPIKEEEERRIRNGESAGSNGSAL